jgi:uncharacterized protein
MLRTTCIVILLLFIGCSGNGERTDAAQETERPARELAYTSEVAFLQADDEAVTTIKVSVADDDASRSEGLMDVHDLPSDAGMLFIFDEDEPRNFWMAGTPLSLDIIFINGDYEIVRIHRNTPPYSHNSIPSEEPAKYVVEVNAGFTMRHDITEGMKIQIEELEQD